MTDKYYNQMIDRKNETTIDYSPIETDINIQSDNELEKLKQFEMPPPPKIDEHKNKNEKIKGKKDIIEKDIIVMDNKKMTLNVKYVEDKRFRTRISKFLAGNFDGYIIKEIIDGNYRLLKVSGMKDIYKEKNSSTYLYKIMGLLDNKPFFLMKRNVPISVNEKTTSTIGYKDCVDLCYDTKAFYTYLDYIALKNLSTKGEGFDFGEWFGKNWWIVIIVLVLAGLLFFTDVGKQLLSQIIVVKPNP